MLLNIKSKVILVYVLDSFGGKKKEIKNKTIYLHFKLQGCLKLYLYQIVVKTTDFTQKAAIKSKLTEEALDYGPLQLIRWSSTRGQQYHISKRN